MNKCDEDDSIRIASNVRVIREYFGDTRKSLSELLSDEPIKSVFGSYSVDTIASYEQRKRPNIPDSYIHAISMLYGVPYKPIKEQTITIDLIKKSMEIVDISEFNEAFDFIFETFVTSEEAKKNDDFCKATEYKEYIEDKKYTREMLLISRKLYYKAFDEKGILAGSANALMMLFFEYYHFARVDNDFCNRMSRMLVTRGKLYSEFEKQVQITDEKRHFIRETKEIFNKCITALAQTYSGRILAEYYMALKYLMCMIDNDRLYRENVEIGRIMMLELSELGNQFAKRAVEFYNL